MYNISFWSPFPFCSEVQLPIPNLEIQFGVPHPTLDNTRPSEVLFLVLRRRCLLSSGGHQIVNSKFGMGSWTSDEQEVDFRRKGVVQCRVGHTNLKLKVWYGKLDFRATKRGLRREGRCLVSGGAHQILNSRLGMGSWTSEGKEEDFGRKGAV